MLTLAPVVNSIGCGITALLVSTFASAFISLISRVNRGNGGASAGALLLSGGVVTVLFAVLVSPLVAQFPCAHDDCHESGLLLFRVGTARFLGESIFLMFAWPVVCHYMFRRKAAEDEAVALRVGWLSFGGMCGMALLAFLCLHAALR
jgi:ABC-type Fe3+-siderophore transport system permease subunit